MFIDCSNHLSFNLLETKRAQLKGGLGGCSPELRYYLGPRAAVDI